MSLAVQANAQHARQTRLAATDRFSCARPAPPRAQAQPFVLGERIALAAGAIAAAAVLHASPASASDVERRFELSCAGCHAGGGNIVQAGATLQLPDLQKNGVADADTLYRIIYSGKGKMPGFGTDCAPKGACTFGPRLADEDVQALTTYVLERAAEGWK